MTLLGHVQDRRISDPNRPTDEYWLKVYRKRTRNSSEAATTESAPPSRNPEKTNSGTKDSKRMREGQSPRTIAQKLAEGDELVPQPGFISAKEKAERDAKKKREGTRGDV
jgi:hypothetical protein